MEEKKIGAVVVPNTAKTTKEYKFKVNFINGGTEGMNPVKPPFLDAQMPGFMNFVLADGKVRQVNLGAVRYIDVEIHEKLDLTI